MFLCVVCFFFQAEDGIRDAQESRGLGDVYKRQRWGSLASAPAVCNIGMRPTFDDQGRGVTLEVHVLSLIHI